jgi:hypothetical protein
MSLVVVGNTTKLAPTGGTTANVANVSAQTTTFHITNASSTVYAYVGVFANYANAIAMDYPTVGTDAGGTIFCPNESMTLTGNFGSAITASQSTVYVAAITASGSSTSVFVTPVAAGSSAT